jgi:drug/metabolite transporter (DMT)-like permease
MILMNPSLLRYGWILLPLSSLTTTTCFIWIQQRPVSCLHRLTKEEEDENECMEQYGVVHRSATSSCSQATANVTRGIVSYEYNDDDEDPMHSTLRSSRTVAVTQQQQQQAHWTKTQNQSTDESSSVRVLVADVKDDNTQAPTRTQQTTTTATTCTSNTSATDSVAAAAADVMKARLLLLGAAALYGSNFAVVKWMLDATDMPVGIQSTLRFALAAVCTAPWLLLSSAKSNTSTGSTTTAKPFDTTMTTTTAAAPAPATKYIKSKEWASVKAGLEVGAWNAVGFVAQAVGLETTLASKSAFLSSLAVVVVPLLDWLFAGKTLRSQQLLGIVLALTGVGFLELAGVNPADLLQLKIGDLVSYLQPLAFGVGFWHMEKAMQSYPDQARRSTAAQLLAVFLCSLVYTAVTWHQQGPTAASSLTELILQLQHWLSEDPWIVAAFLYTGCVTTALTAYMETVALKTLSAAELTLIFSTEPVWGSVTAAVVLGETFGASSLAGGALILAGCVIANMERNNNTGSNTQ